MNAFDANALARVTIEDRIREADHRRLARECQRREQPSTARTAAPRPRQHPRFWSLALLRRAYI